MTTVPSPIRVALAGSTGLIGKALLTHLLQQGDTFSVTELLRRPPENNQKNGQYKLVNYQEPETVYQALHATDAVVCAVGTTNAKVKGNKADYAAVDWRIPALLASAAAKQGCNCMVLVSAVGANSSSSSFYLQLKGQAEQACKQAGISSIYLLRPSLLLGNRPEKRTAEQLAQKILPWFHVWIPSMYRPIHATTIAVAIGKALRDQKKGIHIWHYNDMVAASEAII
jgi:uncharacterized protein YbjT (DUF2867 family)